MIGKKAVKRYNISLPPESAEKLRKIGCGNLSAGIRQALELHAERFQA
jgi:hypothetical protein